MAVCIYTERYEYQRNVLYILSAEGLYLHKPIKTN